MKRVLLAAVALALFGAASVDGQESGQLNAAKNLYASARYDEALTVLDALRGANPADRRSVEQYRSLCLLALGRANEAESAVAAAITADPLFRPGDEASPRVRAMFSEVRKRMIPEIATSRYAMAKATYDRQDWAAAEQQFRLVLSLLDDADNGGRLSDLRLLAVGFLELTVRAATPPPEPPQPDPAPAVTAEPTPSPGPVPAVVSRAPDAVHIYSADDNEVVPPVVVRQEIPSVPAAVISLAKPRGLLEIVIDDLGRVVAMTMRGSIHPSYDTQVLAAARDWKYKPATLNGQPVRFRKLIQVSVKR